jgi:POT family proton-dependent oligopeptide transporter
MIGWVMVVLWIVVWGNLAYDQLFNVGLIWISERVALDLGAFSVPEAWFGAEDSLASILILPVLLGLWRWQAKRGTEPGDLDKIAIGGVIMALSATSLAAGSWLAGEGEVSMVFPAIAFFLSGVSFMYQWPTTLALVSRRAPAKIAALMMAAVYFTAFFSGVGSGFTARWYEPLGDIAFWLLHAGFALGGSLLVLVFGRAIRRRMDALDGRIEHGAAPATAAVA